MKQTFAIVFLFCIVLSGLRSNTCRADDNEETRLIQTLQSTSATPVEKKEACARLKQIGTAHCINAVASLLTDQELSLSARYVLETIRDAGAGRALIDALPKTSGTLQVGVIDSLGARGEKDAVKPLGNLIVSSDTNVASASAEALGHIGGSKAIDLLEHAAMDASSPVHPAAVDGLLMCANRLLDERESKSAQKVFEKLFNSEKSEPIRLAAFRGILFASGKRGIPQMTDAIMGNDAPMQSAALLVASQSTGVEYTKALADLLPNGTVPVQLALIQCLVQRNDPAAMPAVARMTDNPDASVSVAATAALAILGDDTVVAQLADEAAAGNGAKRNAARESLLLLNRGGVAGQMLALLKTSSPAAKAELMRALAGREDKSAVPALLEIGQNGSDTERPAAFQALGQLAGSAEIPRLVKLIVDSHTDDTRSSAADALNSVFLRAQSPGARLDVSAFVNAVQSGSTETRLALLPICSEVTQAPVRDALRAAAADSDANIRDAGVHALCDTKDAELLPDLLKLAQNTSQPGVKLLAIRGCVRLTTQEENVKLPNAKKLDVFTAILNTPLSTQEKQLVLSGVSAVADLKSLEVAEKMLDDGSVHAEAEKAVIQISSGVAKPHPNKARAALKKIMQETADDQTRKSAEDALKKIK